MKNLFMLKSASSTEIVSEVYESESYYMVPVPNSYHYEFYDKRTYACTILNITKVSELED